MSIIPDNTETSETTEVETTTETTTTEETTPASTEESPNYLYADGIGGEGERPLWFKSEKYKTISAQAEAYPELEKKLGSFTGSPKDGVYEIEGVDFENNPLMNTVAEWGAEKGLSNDGLAELVGKVNELASAQVAEDTESALKALGERGEQRINDIADWGRNNLSSEEYVQFQGLVQNAGQVEVMEKLIGMTKNSKLVDKTKIEDTNKRADTESELKKQQLATNDEGKRLMDVDPSYRVKVNKAMKEFYG